MEPITAERKTYCPRCEKDVFPIAGRRGLGRVPAWGCPLCNKWLGDRVAGKKMEGMVEKTAG